MPGEHQKPRCYGVLAAPSAVSEPATGDGSGDLYADVIAARRYLAGVINPGLKFRAAWR